MQDEAGSVQQISLEKTILPGEWRWIGQIVKNVSTLQIPIGADCPESVAHETKGQIFAVGDVLLENAFVIERPPFRLLYVRPDYGDYRETAEKVFEKCPWKVDYDHSLGKKLALTLGYKYVLLIRAIPGVDRSHGSCEKDPAPRLQRGNTCFADRRIIDKWIGRRPKFMQRDEDIKKYDAGIVEALGLTLKQAGKWGYAMGVEDRFVQPKLLRAV